MSDILVTQKGNDPLFAGKSVEELDALLESMTPEGDIPIPAETPVETETPAEATPEPEPEVEAAPAEPEPEVTPEPEEDLAALEAEGERIKREKIEAELASQRAHASRLAGEIGYLREQLKSIPRTSEPYEPQSQGELDRLSFLEQEFARTRAEQQQDRVAQAFASAVQALDTPDIAPLSTEIAALAPKYADQARAAQQVQDPELARQLGDAITRSWIADAKEAAWQARHQVLVERQATTSKAATAAKKATAPSGSGGVSAPIAKTKTATDMTAAEADAWLRENVL